MSDKIRRWIVLHPNWTLTLVTLAALLPFVSKPFNIDDPLFIWAAKQIQSHPANPYGFDVEWGWTAFPMWNLTENPPLTSYFIALWAKIFGWSELSLHFLFLIPSVAAILGTRRLAQHFCNQPMLASLATLFTPVFLISSTTIMCDAPMLAIWIWAIAFWLEGMEKKDFRRLAICSLLATLASLTKYFGLCLVPLLAFHGVVHERRFGRWCFYLAPPLLALAAYQMATLQLYGRPLVGAAMDWAAFTKGINGFSKPENILIALAFVGGCTAPAVFFAPLISKLRTLAIVAVIAAVFSAAIFFGGNLISEKYALIPANDRFWVEIQVAFWAAAGIWVLTLAATDTLRRKDAGSWLLGFWIWGTFLFAAVFNWTVNGRSILPLTPAVAILIFRQFEKNAATEKIKLRFATVALCAGAALALLVALSDFRAAAAVRKCAQRACAQVGQTLWFQGHWGFQFYMQAAGAQPVDFKKSALHSGDELAIPSNNTNLLPLDPKKADHLATLIEPDARWLSTMNTTTGAGFYASVWGPLPFAFGRVSPQTVSIYKLK